MLSQEAPVHSIQVRLFFGTAVATTALAQTPYRAARAADGHPDLNGFWQAANTANWDLQDHAPGAGPMWETGAIGAIPAGLAVV